MPKDAWHYLENQFDAVTTQSRKRMHAIQKNHRARRDAQLAENPQLAPLVAAMEPAALAWETAYGAWRQARAVYRGASKAVENLFTQLQISPGAGGRSRIDEWESKVAGEWPKEHPVFRSLFPRGRAPFTEGGREAVIGELQMLGTRLGEKAGDFADFAAAPATPPEAAAEALAQSGLLANLKVKVESFHAQCAAARVEQLKAHGLVAGRSLEVEPARVALADALYHCLGLLMGIFYRKADRLRIASFFDLKLVMERNSVAEEDEEPLPAAVAGEGG